MKLTAFYLISTLFPLAAAGMFFDFYGPSDVDKYFVISMSLTFVCIMIPGALGLFAKQLHLERDLSVPEIVSSFYMLAAFLASAILLYAYSYSVYGLWDNDKPAEGKIAFLYFSIITWTTVGYGDIRPTNASRMIAASEAMLGYISMGLYIALIFLAIGNAAQSEKTKPDAKLPKKS